jgi:tRNA threonylcarbamoyladenosine biosynthesis protein TsaE
MKTELHDSEETEQFGAALQQALPEKCVLFLYGDLGAGKTTLVRGCCGLQGMPVQLKALPIVWWRNID